MGTFAGRPLCDPRAELDNCLRNGYPTDWAARANSFSCPLGLDSGRAYVLMFRDDLNALDRTPTHSATSGITTSLLNYPNDLVFVDKDARHTFKAMHVVKTSCITPGSPSDPRAVHLVELADPRRRFRFFGSGLRYNVRQTPTGNYVTSTATSATVGFTWAQIWTSIWQSVVGSTTGPYAVPVPSLPATPDATPEGFDYDAWRATDAAQDFLDRLGLALKWDPFAGSFSLVQVGATQTGLANQELANLPRRLFDREPVSVRYGTVPFTLAVYFRNQGGAEGGYGGSGFTTKVASDTTPRAIGQEGTDIVFDDLPALFQGTTNTNSAALQTRANARAVEYFRIRKGFQGGEYRKIYSGFSEAFLPGSEVRCVTWRLLAGDVVGGGPVTIVDRTPYDPDRFSGWRAREVGQDGNGGCGCGPGCGYGCGCGGGPEWTDRRDRQGPSPIPWRHTALLEPQSGGSPPSGYDNYRLRLWNASTDAVDAQFDVWRVSVENNQLAHFAGFKMDRPAFATAHDTPQTLVNTSPATSLSSGSNNVTTFTLDRTGVWLLTGTLSIGMTGAGAPDAFSLVLTPTSGTILFANASTVSWSDSLVTETVAGTRIVKFATLVRVRVASAGVQVAVSRSGAGFATATANTVRIEGVNLG